MKKIVTITTALLLLAAPLSHAAPFAETFQFTQPDGTQIAVWGEGDEFHAVFEHDGYTVLFDRATKMYLYATLSARCINRIPSLFVFGEYDTMSIM